MTTLVEHLLKSYGGFAGNQHRDPASGQPIRINDRSASDRSSVCCGMFVHITDPEKLLLSISNLPMDDDVRRCLRRLDVKNAESTTGDHIEIQFDVDSANKIRQLAIAVRRVAGRGRRYENPNFKWICPRAKASLNRLADFLETFACDSVQMNNV